MTCSTLDICLRWDVTHWNVSSYSSSENKYYAIISMSCLFLSCTKKSEIFLNETKQKLLRQMNLKLRHSKPSLKSYKNIMWDRCQLKPTIISVFNQYTAINFSFNLSIIERQEVSFRTTGCSCLKEINDNKLNMKKPPQDEGASFCLSFLYMI